MDERKQKANAIAILINSIILAIVILMILHEYEGMFNLLLSFVVCLVISFFIITYILIFPIMIEELFMSALHPNDKKRLLEIRIDKIQKEIDEESK